MDTKQAELELTVIRKLMEDSRRAGYTNSTMGVFWTTLMAITIIINYLLPAFEGWLKYTGILWLVSVSVGIIGSIIIARKEKRSVRVKTFAGKILSTVGFSIGGANVIFAFASAVAHAFNPIYIVPIDSIAMGSAFYVIGVIQQLKSLKILTLFWWAGGIFFLAVPSGHCLLYLAVMLLLSVWLSKMEEKKQAVNATNVFKKII